MSAAGQPSRPTSGWHVRPLRLLIVDDEPCLLDALRLLLRDEHDVVITSGAFEVLDMLRGGQRFDVILSDVMMPGMTGVDLCETLAREMPEVADGFVFMSGGVGSTALRQRLAALGRPLLDKPLDLHHARGVIAEVGGGRRGRGRHERAQAGR